MQTFIVIYDLGDYKKWCVVHAQTNRKAAEYIKQKFPGAEVTNVRGPVQEFTV